VTLFDSLQSAANALVRDPEYPRMVIRPEHWAITYRCSVDDVKQALNLAENGSRKLPEELAANSRPAIEQEEIEE
jgi:hypothetical protein